MWIPCPEDGVHNTVRSKALLESCVFEVSLASTLIGSQSNRESRRLRMLRSVYG